MLVISYSGQLETKCHSNHQWEKSLSWVEVYLVFSMRWNLKGTHHNDSKVAAISLEFPSTKQDWSTKQDQTKEPQKRVMSSCDYQEEKQGTDEKWVPTTHFAHGSSWCDRDVTMMTDT